ncbi:MAG: Spy/CpxP family protein refolding chaperone [Afipia felis]|nr:Spy/CpxP family protein refolding chaperone [Afipia felis]
MRHFFKIAIVAFAFLAALSIQSDARPRGGGGGGGVHMGGGRGGGAHFGGGHFGGGGRAFHGGGARFGGAHFGGGGRHFGGARQFHGGGRHVGASRSFTGQRGTRNVGRAVNRGPRNAARTASRRAGVAATANRARVNAPRANAVRQGLRSRSVNGALRNRNALRNPAARTALVAAAATAGWHGWNHGRYHGWWRHNHGGYGWVGPLFWPFAYYDVYDYGLWGYDYGPGFWDYGYGDIYAGLFSPYGYDALSGYLPSGPRAAPATSGGRKQATASQTPPSDEDQLAQMCGADSGDIAGLPIDKIQQAINPNDEQRAALDELGNASVKAAETIRAACPTTLPLTAPARLAAMEQRIEAMKSAIGIIQPPMEKFYGLLNDDQKAKLIAISPREKQADNKQTASTEGSCGITSISDAVAWPTDEINKRLQPSDAQKVKLMALQDATFKAADSLKATCRPSTALTPPARLAAASGRLDALLGAVKSVHAALNDFYGTLSDEQKAQFEAIGPDRSGQQQASNDDDAEQPAKRTTRRSRHHSHGIHGVDSVLRHIITIAR